MGKLKGTTIDNAFWRKIGELIAEERRSKGYSLREVAEATGISRGTLDNYELGRCRIDFKRWKKICEVLQISEKIHLKVAFGLGDYQ